MSISRHIDPVKVKKIAPKGPSEDDRSALSAKEGDLSIYRYYFRSIGWGYFLSFLCTTIAAAFCNSFSGKVPLFCSSAACMLTASSGVAATVDQRWRS